MDLVIAGGQSDSLVPQLSFELPSTASYASERRLLSAFPSGASSFSPTGVRTIRFVLTGEQGWCDPATLRLAFKLRNDSADGVLQLAGGAHVLFDEVRLLCAGTEIERITSYGRTTSSFGHFSCQRTGT
jgi:hypothetical protein